MEDPKKEQALSLALFCFVTAISFLAFSGLLKLLNGVHILQFLAISAIAFISGTVSLINTALKT